MNVLTNLLSLLGDNNLVPAVIPSMALMLAILLVFDPLLKTSALFQQQNSADPLILLGLLTVIPVIILSYTLTALNTYILKIYSGYPFFYLPFFMNGMQNKHKKRAAELIRDRETLRKQIKAIEEKTIGAEKTAKTQKHLRQLKRDYYVVSATYESLYPPNLDEIMPTMFGNILRASEAYAGQRYGLDGVAFWPLLIAVIPPDYQKAIDSARNELAFLVNMSLLAIGFFCLCVTALLYTFILPGILLSPAQFEYTALRYILASILALICNSFFYQACIYSVSSFGMLIRSAFDLFRLDLLKQFRMKTPKTSREEFYVWKDLNELIVLGRHSLTFAQLEYDVKEDDSE